MVTLFETPFPGFLQKAARGEGGQESYCQKVTEKALFFTVFRVRPEVQDQGARSRGPGRKVQHVTKPGKVSSRTPFLRPGTLNIWLLPGLFPQRDSPYNTHLFRPVSHSDREIGSGKPPLRAVAPKGLREPGRTGSEEWRSRFLLLLTGTGSLPGYRA